MPPKLAVKIFTDRYPFIGPAIWILSVQYFINQLIVARAWTTPYSLKHNFISDLGATVCGPYSNRYVCSPLHGVMNASFIMLGVTMAVGSLLIYQEFKESRRSLTGFGLMALAGLGSILVGVFPENTITGLHVLGATITFLPGSVAIIILGSVLNLPRSLKLYTLTSGWVPFMAFFLLVAHRYLVLGSGGVERLVSYPQTIWLIVFGIYTSTNHLAKHSKVH